MRAPAVGRTVQQTMAEMHAELTTERALAEARLVEARSIALSKTVPTLAEYEAWHLASRILDAIDDTLFLLEQRGAIAS